MATSKSYDVITGRITGRDETIKAIKNLGPVGFNAVVAATRATAKDTLDTVRRNTPVRFGALVQSMIMKVKKYKSGTVAAIIGPDRGYKMADPERKKRNTSRFVIPAKYIHLIEFGFRRSPGKRPLTRGIERSGSADDLVNSIQKKLALAIRREARKALK